MSATTTTATHAPIVSALLSAFNVMDVHGMASAHDLPAALKHADALLTSEAVFNSVAVQEAVTQILSDNEAVSPQDARDTAYVLGVAAGLLMAGGAR